MNEYETQEEEIHWNTPVYVKQEAETTEEFMAKKVFHQADFLNAVRCWINARCIALGNKEIYYYRHYGFLIDLMQVLKKDLDQVLSSPSYYPAIEKARKEGLKKLQRLSSSLESDLKIAYDNLPSELTDLISDETNADDLRKALGGLDTSNRRELLGAAPDGFEMLADPFEGTSIQKEQSQPKETSVETPKVETETAAPRRKTFSFNKKSAS